MKTRRKKVSEETRAKMRANHAKQRASTTYLEFCANDGTKLTEDGLGRLICQECGFYVAEKYRPAPAVAPSTVADEARPS